MLMLVGVVVAAATRVLLSGRGEGRRGTRALDILNERDARGELTRDEYERMRRESA